MLKFYQMTMTADGEESTVWMRVEGDAVSYVNAANQPVELPEVHEMAFVTRKAVEAPGE